MKKLVLTSIVLSLCGCAGQVIVLENEQGQRVKCEVSTASAMLTGVLMRDAKMEKCTREYKEQGYTKVIQAE